MAPPLNFKTEKMQLQLTNYEQAKSLKEAGFDVPCTSFFMVVGGVADEGTGGELVQWNRHDNTYSRPTIAHAIMWLREVKGVHTEVKLTHKGNYIARVVNISDNSSVVSSVIPTYFGAERLVLTKSLETLKTGV